MNRTRSAIFASIVLFVLLAAAAAPAWERAYGPLGTFDEAFRRVSPVTGCPAEGPGYVAVGTLDETGLDPEVYVIYTDLAGARIWEFSYDIQGAGLPDQGMAIAEVPGGFVFLSNTLYNGSWSPALSYIPCKGGRPLWSLVYPDTAFFRDLWGRDLIETANGDLAVAGVWWNGGNEDAFLMRVNGAGALGFNVTYDAGGDEAFNALTEAQPMPGQQVGDLVAVGRFSKLGGDLQGLAARVGPGGAIGGAPQCFAHHGVPTSDEVYNSVETLTASYPGQFAMIGTTRDPAWQEDVWLTRGDPCTLFAESRIGSPAGVPPTAERGFDVKEVVGPVISPAPMLAIAGSYAPFAGGPDDGAFLWVWAPNLMPVGGSGRLFGDHGGFDDAFFSLAEDPNPWGPGYVLAGLTETNWGPGDPRDVYLVHHNPFAAPACEKTWDPAGTALFWPRTDLLPARQRPVRVFRVPTVEKKQSTDFPICP